MSYIRFYRMWRSVWTGVLHLIVLVPGLKLRVFINWCHSTIKAARRRHKIKAANLLIDRMDEKSG